MLLFQQATAFKMFNPDTTDLWMGLIGSMVLLIAFAIGGFMLYNKKTADARLKVVLPMLFYMAALLALVSVGGHYLSMQKYPKIGLSKTKLMVADETFPLPRANSLRIESVEDRLTREVRQILMIQISGTQRTLALPDDRYPVKELMELLKKR